MLRDALRARMLDALKAGRVREKEILRVALGEVQTAETRAGRPLGDDEVGVLLRKLVKSNEESIAAAPEAARREVLLEENRILGSLLPRTLGVGEIA